jgi:D-psicose/D-tagatose/L-ribulose 3-epimerase
MSPRLRGLRFVLACAALVAPARTEAAEAAEPAVKIGYCTDDLEQAKAAGFDYAEVGVRTFTALSEGDFAKLLVRHKAVGLPTPVGYLFLPTDMKVTGPDEAREMDYVRRALQRSQRLGIDIIVFGSGPARRVPEGFPQKRAFQQLVAFAKRIAPEAQKQGIVLSVEAQRKEETNIINTTAEAITWVEAVDHPSFQVMVDFFHLAFAKEDPTVLTRAKRIAHVHFANPTGRVFPRDAAEYDYAGFFENLRKIGYRGRISIEARTSDLAADGPKAIAFLRSAYTFPPPIAR